MHCKNWVFPSRYIYSRRSLGTVVHIYTYTYIHTTSDRRSKIDLSCASTPAPLQPTGHPLRYVTLRSLLSDLDSETQVPAKYPKYSSPANFVKQVLSHHHQSFLNDQTIQCRPARLTHHTHTHTPSPPSTPTPNGPQANPARRCQPSTSFPLAHCTHTSRDAQWKSTRSTRTQARQACHHQQQARAPRSPSSAHASRRAKGAS